MSLLDARRAFWMTAPVVPTRADRRARGAVMALFAVNGATYNSLVPRFPALRDGLGLSNTELGTAIAAFPGRPCSSGCWPGR